RREPIPEAASVESGADALQQFAFEIGVLEKPPPRARVADSVLVLENPESLARDILAATYDQNSARAHVLLLDDHGGHAIRPVVRKRFGRMFEEVVRPAR